MEKPTKQKKNTNFRDFSIMMATVFLLAPKPTLDYTTGVDSPFARFANYMTLQEDEETYQDTLKKYRDHIINKGKPKVARFVSLPYSLKYPEYWK